MNHYGLNDDQVRKSKEKYGDNSISEQEKESFWDKLLSNFGDPMIKILIVALFLNVIFVVLHYSFGIGDTEWYEAAGIAAAVLIATVVSTLSEYKNENAFRKLQYEASLIRCKVYRNGEIAEIPINDIVKNDCILLQSGDKIPADGIILDGTIAVDQSVLNGESKESHKVAVPEGYTYNEEETDFLNEYKVFRGSVVCSGNAVMRAETIGDSSVYGQIARELQTEDDRESPLQVKLKDLAEKISRFGYIGGVAIAMAYLVQAFFFGSGGASAYFSSPDLFIKILTDLVQAVMFSVIIIVMAVPEGLPLMIAIVSSMNMKKMLNDQVLVRKVNGIETAGSLNILFSDKTGTITKGKLETVLFIDGAGNEAVQISDVNGKISDLLTLALKHNTDAVITGSGNDIRIVGGNPTDRAILSFVAEEPDNHPDLILTEQIPFDSANKYSASTVTGEMDITLIKGAPERILQNCRYYYDGNGKKTIFDPEDLNSRIDQLADNAIRVLAIATSDERIKDKKLPESGEWTLVGILGIRDEVRPESVTAIKEVNNAGIQVVMITGDRKETAVAIAKDAGLIKSDKNLVFTSSDLSKMTDNEIKDVIPSIRVIARALPSDKSRLVRLSQELGLVVGMTGDGVNDSPALKKADVGFAMGGGTEVAKEASDIVILDDNFNSIAKAVLYGRTIFNNIRKFISFQLTINISAVLISFIIPLLRLSNPLTITQILWVNLVMDTLAALALGGEPALKRYMKEKPKRRNEKIVNSMMKNRLLVNTIWVFLCSLFILSSQMWQDSPVWLFVRNDCTYKNNTYFYPYLLTVYFCYFIFTAIFNSLNVRSEKFNLFEHLNGNRNFMVIMGAIAAIQIVLTYFGGEIVTCYGLDFKEWLFVLCMSVSVIPVDLIRKAVIAIMHNPETP